MVSVVVDFSRILNTEQSRGLWFSSPCHGFYQDRWVFFFLKKRNLKKEIVIQALHVCFYSSFSYFFFQLVKLYILSLLQFVFIFYFVQSYCIACQIISICILRQISNKLLLSNYGANKQLEPREMLSEMMQFLLEIRKTVNIKMLHSFLVTWIGMLQTMTSLKTYQRLTKVLAWILMTTQKTPDFHVFKALGKVAAAEVVLAVVVARSEA